MTTPDELERLARAATPGPWKATKHPESFFRDAIKADGRLLARCQAMFGRMHVPTADCEHNAAFIAAADPATILALLSERAELLAAVERMRGGLEFYAVAHEFPSDGPWGVNSDDFGAVARAALTTGEGK